MTDDLQTKLLKEIRAQTKILGRIEMLLVQQNQFQGLLEAALQPPATLQVEPDWFKTRDGVIMVRNEGTARLPTADEAQMIPTIRSR